MQTGVLVPRRDAPRTLGAPGSLPSPPEPPEPAVLGVTEKPHDTASWRDRRSPLTVSPRPCEPGGVCFPACLQPAPRCFRSGQNRAMPRTEEGTPSVLEKVPGAAGQSPLACSTALVSLPHAAPWEGVRA